ncbi:MAG TPA: sigma-70 family RNA polymerase sigma factor [Polyangiales bacterium]
MQPGHAVSADEAQGLALDAQAAELAALSGASRGLGPATSAALPSFASVYDEYFAFVWRSARRLGVPESHLDDVVQDVFVTVYRRLPDFEGRSQLKTWIFGILRHTISDLRRGQRRKPTSALEQEPVDAREASPQDAAARAEGVKLLHEALASLPDDQREVFVLAELEQLSSPEIAAALDVNLNTVYSRLRSARQEFETALKRLRSRDEWRMR